MWKGDWMNGRVIDIVFVEVRSKGEGWGCEVGEGGWRWWV